jgi:allantoinase
LKITVFDPKHRIQLASSSAAHPPDELPVVLASMNTIIPNWGCTPATIVISATSGKIIDVSSEVFLEARFPPGTDYHEYSPKYLIPGQVDAHAHLNEPGWRTEWECFETGTRAAAFRGVTSLIYMSLNAIPSTTTAEKFEKKVNAAKGQ